MLTLALAKYGRTLRHAWRLLRGRCVTCGVPYTVRGPVSMYTALQQSFRVCRDCAKRAVHAGIYGGRVV